MHQYTWAEDLPEGCPPPEAKPANGEIYYRLANNFPPTEKDFHSPKKLNPKRVLKQGECRARALSVFQTVAECNLVRNVCRVFRECLIVRITIDATFGLILYTPEDGATHYDWWLSKGCNPIPLCILAE